MIHVGGFVRTKRDPELHSVRGIWEERHDTVRLCRLKDGKTLSVQRNQVVELPDSTDQFRKHVHDIALEHPVPRNDEDIESEFVRDLCAYIADAKDKGAEYRISGVTDFIIAAIHEREQYAEDQTRSDLIEKVEWFCNQLGVKSPPKSQIIRRLSALNSEALEVTHGTQDR